MVPLHVHVRTDVNCRSVHRVQLNLCWMITKGRMSTHIVGCSETWHVCGHLSAVRDNFTIHNACSNYTDQNNTTRTQPTKYSGSQEASTVNQGCLAGHLST
jgi:hypothetical protein